MTKPSTEKKNWSDLDNFSFTRFEIALFSPEKLYRNGRQQAHVEAAVWITSHEMPDEHGNAGTVPLSATERASIKLVTFRGDDLSDQWKISRTYDDTYDGYPGRTAGGSPSRTDDPQAAKVEYVDMYVSTTAAAGVSNRMVLSITRDGGPTFISDGRTGDIALSDITLIPERVPDFPIGNFGFEKVRVQGMAGSDLFIDNYYLGLTDNSNAAIPLKSIGSVEAGMIQWARQSEGETRASYTGFGQPGSDVANFNTSINYGSHVPSKKVIASKTNFATILLVGRNDVPYHSPSYQNYGKPCDLTVTDLYGNDHALRVSFKEKGTPEGRFDLVLEKR